MRALRVVGLHEDGKSIVCEDTARRERFLLPADEKLRAATRGDVTRLGQIEIELESQMRPREIQARIRSGESVEQVAATAGVPVQRVERFAYPVLLERSRMAELAQAAHPMRADGPDVQTLSEVVAYAFGVRGQDYSQAKWDSWRGDDGKWVVALSWHAGRSENHAHWSFSPGAHGGTVTTLDAHAEDLLDPNANRALWTLRAVDPEPSPAGTQAALDDVSEAVAEAADPHPERPEHPEEEDDTREIPRVPAEDEDASPAPAPARVQAPARSEPPKRPEPPARVAKGRRNHPIVPSWEDVLLGVRTQRG